MTASSDLGLSLHRRAIEPLVVQVDPALDPAHFSASPHSVSWKTEDGHIHAICEMADGLPRILVPHIGIIRVVDESGHVYAAIHNADRREAIEEVYYRFALPMILQAAGAEMLHASAVLGDSGVVAFCAISGTGKSTLAFSLGRRGREHWADDSVVFWPSEDVFQAPRLSFRPRVDLPSVGIQQRIEGNTISRLSAIVVLQRLGSESVVQDEFRVESRRLSHAEAFRAILPHIYSFVLSDAARNALMMSRYFDLAAKVPVFDVRFTPCIDALPKLCEFVERACLSAS